MSEILSHLKEARHLHIYKWCKNENSFTNKCGKILKNFWIPPFEGMALHRIVHKFIYRILNISKFSYISIMVKFKDLGIILIV